MGLRYPDWGEILICMLACCLMGMAWALINMSTIPVNSCYDALAMLHDWEMTRL